MTKTEAQALTETDTCPTCRDRGLMTCPSHMTKVDADGWCTTCDSPDVPDEVPCICQDA